MSKKSANIDHDAFNERIAAARESSAKAQELARDLGITDRAKLGHEALIKAIELNQPRG